MPPSLASCHPAATTAQPGRGQTPHAVVWLSACRQLLTDSLATVPAFTLIDHTDTLRYGWVSRLCHACYTVTHASARRQQISDKLHVAACTDLPQQRLRDHASCVWTKRMRHYLGQHKGYSVRYLLWVQNGVLGKGLGRTVR